MPLDNIKYEEFLIDYIKTAFIDCFGNDLIFKNMDVDLNHMGWFCLSFIYMPRKYEIIFENDRKAFSIRIIDEDNAHVSLNQLISYNKLENKNNELSEKNVITAINSLKYILEKGEFILYKSKDDKLYKKVNGEYKRIKDIKKEFMNNQ